MPEKIARGSFTRKAVAAGGEYGVQTNFRK
jgi:hypothetical protein